MNDPLLALAFYGLAGVTVVAALAVVGLRSIVHSALALIATFVGVAGIYILLSADFVAAVQVLIYVGAVAVLLLFAIMLTRLPASQRSNPSNSQRYGALAAAGLFFVLLGVVFTRTSWPIADAPPPSSSVAMIGQQLLTTYALPFELASVLLLMAMVGAIVLAREE